MHNIRGDYKIYKIPYGEKYLKFKVPGKTVKPLNISEQTESQLVTNGAEILEKAIKNPIGKRLPEKIEKKKIAIVISDLTRPVPNKIILKYLLKELQVRGASKHNIKIIVGTGKHRLHTQEDFIKLTGGKIAEQYNIVSHDAEDSESYVYLGKTSRNTPLFIDKRFVNADIKIITGMIDPHQFVGFTGGLKAVTIGLGATETITSNHSKLFAPGAKPGVKEGNPVREDIDEVRNFITIDFCINVILNEHNKIIKALAGDEKEVWQQGTDFVKEKHLKKVAKPVDIVIASPGGYPKDINLYQAQKALNHVTGLVKRGGTIILAAECREGIGSQKFLQTMKEYNTATEVMENFKNQQFELGVHKAYLFSKTLNKAHVVIVSDKLSTELSPILKVEIMNDINKAVTKIVNRTENNKKICIVPKASSIIPVLNSN